MRVTGVFQLAKEYMALGVAVALFVICILIVGYSFIYKRLLKGQKDISHKSALAGGVLIFYYVIVLGATVLSRHAVYHHATVLPFFATYREAWNEWSLVDWRNLILNVLMFIPIGFCFPCISKKCQMLWCTYLAGFLMTLFIETLQFFTGRGVFETDDLFNNFMGTAIGYGLYQIVHIILRAIKNRRLTWKITIFSQIPLVCMIIIFLSIFIVYDRQPYGNIKESYAFTLNMKDTKIISNLEYDKERKHKKIYQIDYFTEQETYQIAQEFFQWVGSTVDDSRIQTYQDTVVYWTRDGQKYLEVQYKGGMIKYTNSSITEDYNITPIDITYQKVKDDVEIFGLYIPEDGLLRQETDGWYSMDITSKFDGKRMYGGNIKIRYTIAGDLWELQYQVLASKEIDEVEVISQEEAFACIQQGKFISPCSEILENLEILSVEEQSILDTKGFFQPVYQFTVRCNEKEETTIVIPGMVK